MAAVYLLSSIACSILIAHLLKSTESGDLRTLQVLTVNYLVAFVTAFLVRFDVSIWSLLDISPLIWMTAAFIGLIFIINFLVYSKSVDQNGVGVSIAAMRLSLLIPVAMSIFWYQELLTGYKVVGVVLVFGALYLLLPRNIRWTAKSIGSTALLVGLFLLTGLGDSSLKVYEEEFSTILNESFFMGMVFLSAFVIGLISVMIRKGSIITRREVVMGGIIGIPNLYSSIFLIYALQLIDGAIAYTFVNIGNVLGGTLLGKIIWKDQITRYQWIGIGTALVAITLLVI